MSVVSYFLLSDIHKNVKVKISSIRGRGLSSALGIAALQSASGEAYDPSSPMSLAAYMALSNPADCELYFDVAIYSNGRMIGTSSLTTYRRFTAPSAPALSVLPPAHEDHVRFNEWISFPVKYHDLLPTSRLVVTVYAVTHYDSALQASVSTPTSPAMITRNGDGVSNDEQSGSIAFPLCGSSMPMFNKKGLLKLGRRKLHCTIGRVGDGSINSKTPYKDDSKDATPNSSARPHNESVSTLWEALQKRIRKYDQRELPSVKWLDKITLETIDLIKQQANHNSVEQSIDQFLIDSSSSTTSTNAQSTNNPNISLDIIIDFPKFAHPIVYFQKTCNPPVAEVLVSPPQTPLKHPLFVVNDPEQFRDNPIEQKYHKLSRSSKGLADRDLRPKIIERKELAQIVSSPNKRLSPEGKELLWKFRYSLMEDKRALTKFLRCVDWSDVAESKEALELTEKWAPIDIADALELLSAFFTNESVRKYAVKQLQKADQEELGNYLLQLVQALRYEERYPSFLSEFISQRCTESLSLANFLYWYLKVEERDPKKGAMFGAFLKDFLIALRCAPGDGAAWFKAIEAESELINQLCDLSESAKAKNVAKRIERMRASLSEKGAYKHLRSFPEPIRLPVRPEIFLSGIIGDKSTMFKSALAPMLICFSTPANDIYRVMFKRGDDLRQDQLIIQMINLMDNILKKVGLDLQLTPYRVLATGRTDGLVEYVAESYTVKDVLEKFDNNILKFIHFHNPSKEARSKCLDTFVHSCAGYCVITYILGIGDRHLENVLLTTSGHLFHIDFGYIFGRDPKPYPPPMKFSKEMVDCMGGASSQHYHEFKTTCQLAFNILRKHAPLILNLLSLMGDANIPHLSDDVDKNLLKVENNLKLELNDEEAGFQFSLLIDRSVSALFPQMMEKLHAWAVYWK